MKSVVKTYNHSIFSSKEGNTDQVIVSHSNPIPSDLVHTLCTDGEILSYLKRDFP